MAILKECLLVQGKNIFIVSPIPRLEAATKGSIPNACALHLCWVQWALAQNSSDIKFGYDPTFGTQYFLQYQQAILLTPHIFPIYKYNGMFYENRWVFTACELALSKNILRLVLECMECFKMATSRRTNTKTLGVWI